MIKPSVLVLTTAHHIDDARVAKFTRSLAEHGHRVTWVGPEGRRFGAASEGPPGVEARLYPRRPGKLGRLLGIVEGRRLAAAGPAADVIYAPDLDAAWVSLGLRDRRRRGRVVLDLHEVFDGALMDRLVPGPLRPAARKRMRRWIEGLVKRSDALMAVSTTVAEGYARLARQCLIVRNCPSTAFADAASGAERRRDQFRVMHGLGDLLRGTPTVLEAASRSRSGIDALRLIVFNVFESSAAYGEQAFRESVERLGLSQVVELMPRVLPRDMPRVLGECHAGLIAYGRALGEASLPNRLFEYMAAGVAVVAPTYSPEICRILDAEGCGVAADFEDPDAIARALVTLARDPGRRLEMGRRGQSAFRARHNWETEVQPFLDLVTAA